MTQKKLSLTAAPPASLFEARVAELLKKEDVIVLVTILSSQGSAPRHAGTRAVMSRAGFEGTVGGGILEAQVIKAAADCLETQLSKRIFFSLDVAHNGLDMICGGNADVLCELIRADAAQLFIEAAGKIASGERGVWQVENIGERPATEQIVRPKRRLLSYGDSKGPEEVRLSHGECGDVYSEELGCRNLLLLCGAGHVSLEVARLASDCGFLLDVVDDRAEFSNPERFPMARHCYVLPDYADLVRHCQISTAHLVVILTRGHSYDQTVLEQVLAAHPFYVGMIGSRAKRDQIYANLLSHGSCSKEQLAQVCCPVGLPIRAETPKQIAVSVVAELLAAQKNVLAPLRAVY